MNLFWGALSYLGIAAFWVVIGWVVLWMMNDLGNGLREQFGQPQPHEHNGVWHTHPHDGWHRHPYNDDRFVYIPRPTETTDNREEH